MRKIKISLCTFISIIFINCDSNRCDDGYSEVNNSDGSSYCIKNFESGIQNRIDEFGNSFYHEDYGIIQFKEGKWYNQFNESILLEN